MIDWEKHEEYHAQDRFAKYNSARKQGLQDWVKYIQSEESGIANDKFGQILFLEGIIKEIKPDNAYTPPAISHEAFEAVYNQLLEGDTTVSVTKAYAEFNKKKALAKYGEPTVSADGVEGTWVRIPQGGKRGEPDYDERIAMIQALSEGSSWCLRFENAHNYLAMGDLHFFVDKNGNSQTAINVKPNGEIREIEKRYKQDRTVPVPYVEVIKEWKSKNGFTGFDAEIEVAMKEKPEFDRQKAEFAKMQAEGDDVGIFEKLGYKVKPADKDGQYLSVEWYKAMVQGKTYTVFDLGIDENKLFSRVQVVEGNFSLDGSALTSAQNLKEIRGKVTFGDNKISDLRSLEQIGTTQIYWSKP